MDLYCIWSGSGEKLRELRCSAFIVAETWLGTLLLVCCFESGLGVSGFGSGGPFLFLGADCGERGWRGRERGEARRGKCKCACWKAQ